MITFHIVTLFPEMFESYLDASILKRAHDEEHVRFSFYNPRDFTEDPHRQVDDQPYGGGPGMVVKALPVARAVDAARTEAKEPGNTKIFLLSPRGQQFTNEDAETLASEIEDIILIAGRYEGIDGRIREMFDIEEVSIGPYTLTGGELPALVIIDAVTRRMTGVLGDASSVEERRTAASIVYTRPETIEYKGKEYAVPEVLLSGDHKKIEEWRASGDKT